MMDERELRGHFDQLREADRDHTPSFAQTYSARARLRLRPRVRMRPLVIGAAAAVAIAAILFERGRSFPLPTATPAITTWRAPTDVFLRAPGSELLGAMPALGASVLDKMISTPSKTGA
jgi:hypothetical protein